MRNNLTSTDFSGLLVCWLGTIDEKKRYHSFGPLYHPEYFERVKGYWIPLMLRQISQ